MAEWWVFGLQGTAPWPRERQTLTFQDLLLVLLPAASGHWPSIAVELTNTCTPERAQSTVNEFLTALAWAEADGFSVAAWMSAGQPQAVPKRELRHLRDGGFRYIPVPSDPRAKLALALYREGHTVNQVPYRFLAFFKIINILFNRGPEQVAWINANLTHIGCPRALERISVLTRSEPDIGSYLYTQGRCAVSHAFTTPIVNPDDPTDIVRLNQDMPVIEALAQIAIERELQVASRRQHLHEHLYELQGFRELLGVETIKQIKNGADVRTSDLVLPETLTLAVCERRPIAEFENLHVAARAVRDGAVGLLLGSADDRLQVELWLDFANERLKLDVFHGIGLRDDETVEATRLKRAVFLLRKEVFLNGELEVWTGSPPRLLGRTDPFIPVNVDLPGTINNWNAVIATLDQQLAAGMASPTIAHSPTAAREA